MALPGITHEDIVEYVDKAYSKTNDKDYLPYAHVDKRLMQDVSGEVDLDGYTHALRDNDIRHIRNSHGEGTNEKYPVSKADLAKIPHIVTHYDKVFAKTNANGTPGLVYVKVGEENVTYYVEAVTTEYHGEKLLVNKQMIKTGIEDIPNLRGLRDAINKKESSSQYLADLQEIRKAYVQDVKENRSTISIPDSGKKINPSDENSSGRRDALPEEEYSSPTSEAVMHDRKEYKPSVKESLITAKDRAIMETVNEQHGIEKYLKRVGGYKRAEAAAAVQRARASRSQAQTMIGSLQYNVMKDNPTYMGEGLLEIFKPTLHWSNAKNTALDDYLVNYVNVDRMTLEERTTEENIKNKPVFGKRDGVRDHDVTAEESMEIIKEIERKFPDIPAMAKKVWTYSQNLLQMRVEAGLITRESADFMKKLYPHYVPSYRDTEGHGIAPIKGDKTLSVSSTIRGAKGGGEDILDVANSIAAQTDELMRAGHINMLAGEIYDAAKASGDTTYVEILSEEADRNFGEKRFLSNSDLAEYLSVGKTLHTRHKKERLLAAGKKPIITLEKEFRKFMLDVINGRALGEVRAFGVVPGRLAQAILSVRKTLDMSGNYLELQADALRESYKRHKQPKEKGDIPLSEDDFANLADHIHNFDGVLSINDYNGKTEVHLYRKSEQGYYQIITVVSSERKSLQITKLIGVSAEKFEQKFAKKIERNTGSPRMLSASTPSTKARHTAGVLSTISIPNSNKKVNPLEENSEGRDVATQELLRPKAGRLYRHFETALKELSAENRARLAEDSVSRTNGEKTQISGEGKRLKNITKK